MSIGVERGGALTAQDFERSITAISQADDLDTRSLPRRATLSPVDEGRIGSRTETLLNPKSTHDLLLARYLQPPVADASVVAPGRYRRLLKASALRLRQSQSEQAPAVRRAADVLEEVQGRMDDFAVQMSRLLQA